MSNDAELRLGANTDELSAGLAKAQAAVKEASEQMKAALEGVGQAFEKINAGMAALTAVLAGGKAFKEAVEASVGAATGASKLGRELGITATQASILKVAMDENFVPMEAVEGAANKIAAAIKKNPAEFQRMGVAIRDSNGNMRNSFDIMQDVNEKLAEMKDGTARNVEGQRIYGKAWGEIAPTIRLTKEAMDEATEKAESLGLVIGKEGVAQAMEYRKAMAGVHTVFDGIEKAIGDAVIPALTTLARWFESVGPQAIAITRTTMQALGAVFGTVADIVKALWGAVSDTFVNIAGAIISLVRNVGEFLGAITGMTSGVMGAINEMFGGPSISIMDFFINTLRLVEVAFITVRVVIQEAAEVIAGGLEGLLGFFNLFATVAQRALTMNWSGVQSAWSEGMAKIEQDAAARLKNIVDLAKKAGSDVDDALTNDLGKKATVTPTDDKKGKNTIGDDDAGKSRMQQFENELAQAKLTFQAEADARGELLEFSKQQEIDYWTKILATRRTSAEETKQIMAKILTDELAIDKERLQGNLATLKNEETEAGKNLQARLAAEMKYAEAVKGIYGTQSKEYAEAQKAILTTQQATIEQRKKVDEIQITSDKDVQLAAINNAEASAKEQFELKRINLQQLIELQRKYEEEKYQLALKAAADELAIVNPNDDPAAYSQRLAQIRQIAAQHQQQLLAIDKTANTEEIALQTKLTNAMSQGFAQAFSGIIKGTETLHKAMTQVYSSILNLVITTLSKMLAQFIATHLVQMIATKEQQTQDAAGGAVAAGKSAAAIPVIGWALSLGAMASFFAAASGYSAEGGYDIPRGLNPQTQLHEREMVLPAPIADPLREAIKSGQFGGGGPGMTINANMVDARGMKRALDRGGVLEKAIRDLHRRGKR